MLISEFARKTGLTTDTVRLWTPPARYSFGFQCVLLRKLRRFCSALRALINYLVPAAAPSRFNRLDRHRARCLAFRTVHQRVEAGTDLV